ncbi:hypothetical protein BDV93DRAFT_592669 [Ceratobasidium sp. AG-I]|nr:hypothetical protein BDV93DRAFT_592669 [Ceratobasidium sp. AG-I]
MANPGFLSFLAFCAATLSIHVHVDFALATFTIFLALRSSRIAVLLLPAIELFTGAAVVRWVQPSPNEPVGIADFATRQSYKYSQAKSNNLSGGKSNINLSQPEPWWRAELLSTEIPLHNPVYSMPSHLPSVTSIPGKRKRIEEIEYTLRTEELLKVKDIHHGDTALALLGKFATTADTDPKQGAAALRKVDK